MNLESRARKISVEAAEEWAKVGDGEIFVSDVIDQEREPEAKMTVGFARVGAGEELEISFPYDEVLVLTRGVYTVRTHEGEAVTARAGDVIYLPGGAVSTAIAEEDSEMAYVASPPSVYAEHVARSS
jgi:ethanolamine utilization protein EutQ (cupin superfamily)